MSPINSVLSVAQLVKCFVVTSKVCGSIDIILYHFSLFQLEFEGQSHASALFTPWGREVVFCRLVYVYILDEFTAS